MKLTIKHTEHELNLTLSVGTNVGTDDRMDTWIKPTFMFDTKAVKFELFPDASRFC